MACKICCENLSINPFLIDPVINNNTLREDSVERGIESHLSVTKCGHVLHHICLSGWFEVCSSAKRRTECPTCGSQLEANQYTMLYPHNGLMNSQDGLAGFGRGYLDAGTREPIHSPLLSKLKEEMSSTISNAGRLELETEKLGLEVSRLINVFDAVPQPHLSSAPFVGKGRGNRRALETNTGQTELKQKLKAWEKTRVILSQARSESINLFKVVIFVENSIAKAGQAARMPATAPSQEVTLASTAPTEAVTSSDGAAGSVETDDTEDLTHRPASPGHATSRPMRGTGTSGSARGRTTSVTLRGRPAFGSVRGTITFDSTRRPATSVTNQGPSRFALATRSRGGRASSRPERIPVGRGISTSSVNLYAAQRRTVDSNHGSSRGRTLASSTGSLAEPQGRSRTGVIVARAQGEASRRGVAAAAVPRDSRPNRGGFTASTRNVPAEVNSSSRQVQGQSSGSRREAPSTSESRPTLPTRTQDHLQDNRFTDLLLSFQNMRTEFQIRHRAMIAELENM